MVDFRQIDHTSTCKMSWNTTELQKLVTSATIENSRKDDTLMFMAMFIAGGIVLLVTVGVVITCLIKRRRNTKAGTIFGHGDAKETTNTRCSRESGAYRSYDAINEDVFRDSHVEMGREGQKEATNTERMSKTSTASGAYRSFDDFENTPQDVNARGYDHDVEMNRDLVRSYDFETRTTRTISVITNEGNVSKSVDDREDVKIVRTYGSRENLGDPEMLEDLANREIDNPLFSEVQYYDR